MKELKGKEALEAVKEDGLNLRFVREQTPEICLEAVKQDTWALQYVREQTPEICLETVKEDGRALQYVREQTPEICLEAVKEDGRALKHVREQTPEICLEAVKEDGRALKHVREQTPEICLEAVKEDGRALKHVREQTPEICLEAVKEDTWALQYVREQTPEICLETVKEDGRALQFVREQTPEICLEAVKQYGRALAYVKEQTPEICLEAVKDDPTALLNVNEEYVTFELFQIVRAICERLPYRISHIHYPELKDSFISGLINETGRMGTLIKRFVNDSGYITDVICNVLQLLAEYEFSELTLGVRVALKKNEDVRSIIGTEVLIITEFSLDFIKKFICEKFNEFFTSDLTKCTKWARILSENFDKIAVVNNDKYVSFCHLLFVNHERLISEETDEFGILRDYYNDTNGIVEEDSIKYVVYDK